MATDAEADSPTLCRAQRLGQFPRGRCDRGRSRLTDGQKDHAPPLIWATEGSRTPRAGRDHAAVGRLLLDAGSPLEWQPGAEPAERIVEIVNAWRGVA